MPLWLSALPATAAKATEKTDAAAPRSWHHPLQRDRTVLAASSSSPSGPPRRPQKHLRRPRR
eukprot:5082583-Alexandrium_andersonii.AAC.1